MPPDTTPPLDLKESLRLMAQELGFCALGVAPALPAPHGEEFLSWLENGHQGSMQWLEKNPLRRIDPKLVLESAQSLLVFLFPYGSSVESSPAVASYAWGEDYHPLLEKKLTDICLSLENYGGEQKLYVDTGPLLERDLAVQAGLGWCGKSNLFIHPHYGSKTLLACIITSLKIEPDLPQASRCGFCTRCLKACPTGALKEPYNLDSRRCLSYLTIENKGSIPLEFRRLLGGRIYGCDSCLNACPWNKKSQPHADFELVGHLKILKTPLSEIAQWEEEDFMHLLAHSPIKRIKYPAFMRNVCTALGNVGTSPDKARLRQLAQHPHPLIAEHAQWALAEITSREELSFLPREHSCSP